MGIAFLTLKDCLEKRRRPPSEIDPELLHEMEKSFPRWSLGRETLLNPRFWLVIITHIVVLIFTILFFWPAIFVGDLFLKQQNRP